MLIKLSANSLFDSSNGYRYFIRDVSFMRTNARPYEICVSLPNGTDLPLAAYATYSEAYGAFKAMYEAFKRGDNAFEFPKE